MPRPYHTRAYRAQQLELFDHDVEAELAHGRIAALLNDLHDAGVEWGPHADKAHLAFCRARELLAEDVREYGRETRRSTLSSVRARLRG